MGISATATPMITCYESVRKLAAKSKKQVSAGLGGMGGFEVFFLFF